MEKGKALETPANRKWFLDQVARGADADKAAEALDTSRRSVQRYARENAAFKRLYDQAKRQGRTARKSATTEIELAPPPGQGEGAVARVYLEEVQKALPDGLKLNAHLPPLSVESHLGKCQAIMYDKTEPTALRIAAMKQIGAHTLMPALRRPSRSEAGTEDAEAQATAVIPGTGPQVVVLIAPDNGLYAPGCGPGQPAVVREEEPDAVGAEVVEVESRSRPKPERVPIAVEVVER